MFLSILILPYKKHGPPKYVKKKVCEQKHFLDGPHRIFLGSTKSRKRKAPDSPSLSPPPKYHAHAADDPAFSETPYGNYIGSTRPVYLPGCWYPHWLPPPPQHQQQPIPCHNCGHMPRGRDSKRGRGRGRGRGRPRQGGPRRNGGTKATRRSSRTRTRARPSGVAGPEAKPNPEQLPSAERDPQQSPNLGLPTLATPHDPSSQEPATRGAQFSHTAASATQPTAASYWQQDPQQPKPQPPPCQRYNGGNQTEVAAWAAAHFFPNTKKEATSQSTANDWATPLLPNTPINYSSVGALPNLNVTPADFPPPRCENNAGLLIPLAINTFY
jgi:hypothetical protein